MVAPLLKSQERFNELHLLISQGKELDLWTFRDTCKEFEDDFSVYGQLVIALAHIAHGKIDDGLDRIEVLLSCNNLEVARLYCRYLSKYSRLERLDKCIYNLSEQFASKELSYRAGGTAFLMGRISLCKTHLQKHASMLSEEEGRATAEAFMNEMIDDMNEAYKASGCTLDQYSTLAITMFNIAEEFGYERISAGVSGRHGGSYTVELPDANPATIAEMNDVLADTIATIDLLDDCNLVARFSVERSHVNGVAYDYL
ncbi:hypothetical protein [Rosenbergiella nectarea]|uniref:hypothetical protein n=1 Tax=Rosenbergiella nectarea TaxID=988801 RepID=UPI001F4D48F1|nr:hypothetical protein [Rosenbergiella nectarea]